MLLPQLCLFLKFIMKWGLVFVLGIISFFLLHLFYGSKTLAKSQEILLKRKKLNWKDERKLVMLSKWCWWWGFFPIGFRMQINIFKKKKENWYRNHFRISEKLLHFTHVFVLAQILEFPLCFRLWCDDVQIMWWLWVNGLTPVFSKRIKQVKN